MPQIALAIVKECDVQQLESDIGLVSLTTHMLITCDLNIAEMHYHTKVLSYMYFVKALECLGAFFHCDLDHDQMISMLKFGQDILQYQNEVSMLRHSESLL